MIGFESLLEYYRRCFALIDVFHFNSNNTKSQYEKYSVVKECSQVVLPITHENILDRREKKTFCSQALRVGFVGSTSPYKGFSLLKDALVDAPPLKWRLDVWGGRIGQDESLPIYYRGRFSNKEIMQVYREMDVLVVPSICHETFSLATLEALSYGVPVLVSTNVGAKDIVKEYDASFVYNDFEDLKKKMRELIDDRSSLYAYNQAILQHSWNHGIFQHAEDVIKKLYLEKI